MLTNIYYRMASNICLARREYGSILVLMYHEVQKDEMEIESWTVVRQSDFENQMLFLLGIYTVISMDEALKLLTSNSPLDKNYIVITFDDGYSGNYDVVFPFIKQHNIPIMIYVATKATLHGITYWYDEIINILQGRIDYVVDLCDFNGKKYHIKSNMVGEKKWSVIQSILTELKKLNPEERELALKSIHRQVGNEYACNQTVRHLTINEISEMSESPLVTIGAHSHCHSILPSISHEAALNSINESKHLLETWISKPIAHFSYPNGDYNYPIIDMLIQSGFISGVTTSPEYWQHSDSSFEIPRLGIGRYDSIEKFKFRLLRPRA